MSDNDLKVLRKILTHINAVISYCESCKSLADFQSDPMRIEACVFNLMQIGELAKTDLSDAAKSQINTIPWNQIYGMRNRLVHGYSGVDMRIIWDTIYYDLADLKKEIERSL